MIQTQVKIMPEVANVLVASGLITNHAISKSEAF